MDVFSAAWQWVQWFFAVELPAAVDWAQRAGRW